MKNLLFILGLLSIGFFTSCGSAEAECCGPDGECCSEAMIMVTKELLLKKPPNKFLEVFFKTLVASLRQGFF